MRPPLSRSVPALMVAAALAMSCSFFSGAASQTDEGPAAPEPAIETPALPEGEISSDEMEGLTDPRVEAALSLRSVQMVLEVSFPGEATDRSLVFVDASGNQRIEMTTPIPEDAELPPTSEDWNVAEIFVVDGQAYSRMGKIGSVELHPEEADALSQMIYNPTGPGLWLLLAPGEAFTSTIEESQGGFDCIRYALDTSLEGGDVWGEIWVDQETGALIEANLSISEGLLRPVESGTEAEVLIYFSVEKAEVPPIEIP